MSAKFITALQIGVQECVCHLTQTRLSVGSRKVIWVNTNLSQNRVRIIKKAKQKELNMLVQGEPEDWEDILEENYTDGLREHNMNRSQTLKDICFGEWIQKFEYMLKYTKSQQTLEDNKNTFKQNKGVGYSRKRKNEGKPRILKIKPHDPYTSTKEWMFQQLLLWTSWEQPIKLETFEEIQELYIQKKEEIQQNRTKCDVKEESFIQLFNKHVQDLTIQSWDETGMNSNTTNNPRKFKHFS